MIDKPSSSFNLPTDKTTNSGQNIKINDSKVVESNPKQADPTEKKIFDGREHSVG